MSEITNEMKSLTMGGKTYNSFVDAAARSEAANAATSYYSTEQDLTEEQKAQARANIGAAAEGESGGGNSGSGEDYIVEQSFGSNMRYRKWASGFAEIWLSSSSYPIADEKTIEIQLPFSVYEGRELELPPWELREDHRSFPMVHTTPGLMSEDNSAISVKGVMVTNTNTLLITYEQIGDVQIAESVNFYAYITCFWKD